MRHMHGAEHGAEREAMKALPQGQIDALHNMAKNMDPAELMYMRHNPSLIEEAKGFMNTESADSSSIKFAEWLIHCLPRSLPLLQQHKKREHPCLT